MANSTGESQPRPAEITEFARNLRPARHSWGTVPTRGGPPMTTPAAVLRHLRRQFGTATSDADLLRAYADHRDADAFRALVDRHGPMILGVCRRRLGDVHAADDAFQATFLALARNPSGLRRPDTLATWLYKVAVRVCGRARRLATRRREVEKQAVPRLAADPA